MGAARRCPIVMDDGTTCGRVGIGKAGWCDTHRKRAKAGRPAGAPIKHGGHFKAPAPVKEDLAALRRELFEFIGREEYAPRTIETYTQLVNQFSRWSNDNGIEDPWGAPIEQQVALWLIHRSESSTEVAVAAIAWEAHRRNIPFDSAALNDLRRGISRRTTRPAGSMAPRTLTIAEIKRLCQAREDEAPARSARRRAAVLLTLHLGLKPAELRALRLRDIRFDGGELHVRIESRKRNVVAADDRTLRRATDRDLDPLAAIKDWLRHVQPEGEAAAPERFLFCRVSKRGQLTPAAEWSRATITADLASDAAALQVPNATWSGIRQTFVLLVRSEGATLAQVQIATGHRKHKDVKNLERRSRNEVRSS